MKPVYSNLIAAFLLVSCSTRYMVVEPSTNNPTTFNQFTRKLSGGIVTVQLKNGEEFEAREFRVEDSTCHWIDPGFGIEQTFATREILRVVEQDRFLGGLEGCTIGLLIGCGGGAVIGRAIEGPPEGEFGALGIAFVSFLGGIGGTVWGTIYGVSEGHKYEYEFVWFTRKQPPQEQKE